MAGDDPSGIGVFGPIVPDPHDAQHLDSQKT